LGAKVLATSVFCNVQMAVCSPSTKLLAVVHVGVLSGVVQTPHQEALSNRYELHGAALDVCRQMLTQSASTSELFTVLVTQDAVDNDGGGIQSGVMYDVKVDFNNALYKEQLPCSAVLSQTGASSAAGRTPRYND